MKRQLVLLMVALLLVPAAVWAQSDEPGIIDSIVELLYPGTRQNMPDPSIVEGGEIEFGGSVDGQLDEETQVVAYTFEGEAEQTVVITLVSEDFDTFLELRDSRNQVLITDDDSGPGPQDSRINAYNLPSTGEYTLIVQSYDRYYSTGAPLATGDYTLSLGEIVIRNIEYTQVVEDELMDETTQNLVRFNGSAGDNVLISVESDEFEPYLSITGPDTLYLSPLAVDTTSLRSSSVYRGAFVLPREGSYTIAVSANTGTGGGSYTLETRRYDPVELTVGDTLETEWPEGQRILFGSFEGEAGNIIRLSAEGAGMNSGTIILTGPDGFTLSYQSATLPEGLAADDVVLAQDGTYTVVLQSYLANAAGDLRVTLETAEIASLDEGTQAVSLTSSDYRETLVFEGEAGTAMRLTVEVDGDRTFSPSINLTQDQINIAYVSGGSVKRQSFDFTVPGDGPVYVQVDDYSYSDVTVNVSVEEVR
jgi:hypothetical protein